MTFIFPTISILILISGLYLLYKFAFFKKDESNVKGKLFFTWATAFFWGITFIALISSWQILFTIIDLKYPDLITNSNYGYYGINSSLFDDLTMPLALLIVSTVFAVMLGVWLTNKIKKVREIKSESLNNFLRIVVYVGTTVYVFFGFVYVVYLWLSGGLQIAVLLKGVVIAFTAIVTSAYFYLTTEYDAVKNYKLGLIFSSILALVAIFTVVSSFKVAGTPKEIRSYKQDLETLSLLKDLKNEVDSRNESGVKVNTFEDLNNEYTAERVKKNGKITYQNSGAEYKLCGNFERDVPKYYVSLGVSEEWKYSEGQKCFTFKVKTKLNNDTAQIGKPILIQ